jgi:hypothetical protein
MKRLALSLVIVSSILLVMQRGTIAAGSRQTLETTRYSDPKCFSAAKIVPIVRALSTRGSLLREHATTYESPDVSITTVDSSDRIQFAGASILLPAPSDRTVPRFCTSSTFPASAETNVSFLALEALNAVLAYRQAHPWPYQPVDLSAPGSSVVLVGYAPAVLITLHQQSLTIGCGITESYRVDFPGAIVRPYDSCLDGRLSKLPAWDDLPHI